MVKTSSANNEIIVSIICPVYNHEPYLKKTLDSLLMQKTAFQYEIIIHDDASTDGSLKIIEEYEKKSPEKIVVIKQDENKYQKGINITSTYIYPKIRGKYISCCEGDDYWTDCDMLQEQYDFLQANDEYVAVGGITKYYDDNGREVIKSKPAEKYYNRELKKEDHYRNRDAVVTTSTFMYKKEVINNEKFLKAREESTRIGDSLLTSMFFEIGKVYVIGKQFQHHRIQTRKNPSNYNNLYSYKQKFLYSIKAVNAIYNNICNERIVANKIRRHTALFFCYCFVNFKLPDYFECRKEVNKGIKEPTFKILVREVPSIIKEKIVDYFTRSAV